MSALAAARVDDLTEGHPPGFPPTKCLKGSEKTIINGKGACRVGDPFDFHRLPFPPIQNHDSVSTKGSTSVVIDNLSPSRVTDTVSCSDKIAVGSPDTFIG
jgi:uncharacterized Zn-binding protein involved in type VI secretion